MAQIDARVDVVITDEPRRGELRFELRSRELMKEGKLTFESPKPGDYFMIDFAIDDSALGERYFFPRKMEKALSVQKVTKNGRCPPGGKEWEEFRPVKLSDDCRTLTVRNENSYLQYFGFALFVRKDPDKGKLIAYDPIGDNRNGGFGPATGRNP